MRDLNGTGLARNKQGDEISFYWQQYGLDQDPFPAVFDETSYFPLPSWEQHLDLLQHLIKNENVLLAIIGAEGQGKTTFAFQLQQLFNDSFQIHSFAADSLFSTRKLVRELEAGFSLKAPINESPDEQLDSQIAEVQHKEKTCLLIIDDAHFLPLETLNSLRFLLKQQSKNQMQLHIILFGDKNLQAKLANLIKNEMHGNIVHTIEFEPLNFEETKQYLYYRLNKAGLVGALPLTQIEIEKIHTNSNGIPDKINYFAQQILLENIIKQKNRVTSSMFKRHQTKIIGGSLLVVALITASYVLNKQGQMSSPQAQQPVISFGNQNQQVAPPAQPPMPQTVANSNQQNNIDANNSMSTDSASSMDSSNDNTASNSDYSSDNTASNNPNEAMNNSNTVTANTNNSITDNNSVSMQQQANSFQTNINQSNSMTDTAKTHISKIPAIAPLFNNAEKNMTHLVTNQKTQVATVTHKAVATAVVISKESTASTAVASNILKQNNNDYTLQILGLSNEQAMLDFINQNHLQGQAHYYKTSLNGKSFYVLVYGAYQTEQEAIAASKNLPMALKKFQPWPRTFASLRTAVG